MEGGEERRVCVVMMESVGELAGDSIGESVVSCSSDVCDCGGGPVMLADGGGGGSAGVSGIDSAGGGGQDEHIDVVLASPDVCTTTLDSDPTISSTAEHHQHLHLNQQQQQQQQQHRHEVDDQDDQDVDDGVVTSHTSADQSTTSATEDAGGVEAAATVVTDVDDDDDDDMIDSAEFRTLTGGHGAAGHLHEAPSPYSPGPLNGRMSPQSHGGYASGGGAGPGTVINGGGSSSYATLTPLQPLPPISTVSDKFRDHYHHHHHHNHHPNVTGAGTFALMQNNSSIPGMVTMNQYQYTADKLNNLGLAMSPTLGSAVMAMSHQPGSGGQAGGGGGGGGMPSPPYHENGLGSPPQPTHKSLSPSAYDAYRCLSGHGAGHAPQSPVDGLQSPGPGPMLPNINGIHHQQNHSPPSSASIVTTHLTVHHSGGETVTGHHHHHHHQHHQQQQQQASIPHSIASVSATTTGLTPAVSREHKLSPKSSPTPAAQAPGIVMGTTPVQVTMTVSGAAAITNIAAPSSSSSNGSSNGEVEEINTKELAARISAELKRYSIPQAIFAQRVLCRSQGTLSDLLRNPKPWSKLKSGRETFRRMYKWLEEPEFQRMSALRLAGK